MDLLTSSDADAASAAASASGFPAGRISNSLPRKTRSACNRCHSQKLRCIRKSGQINCERCLKLKTLCRFSPRVPRATLKQPEPAGLSSLDRFHGLLPTAASMLPTNAHANDLIPDLNGSDSSWPISTEMGATIFPMPLYTTQDFHWPGPLPELHPLSPICQDSLTLPNFTFFNENNMIGVENQDIHDSFGPSIPLVQKLASLNVALHECGQKLPSMNKTREGSTPGRGPRKATIFAIDELFRLTAEFIEVTKSFSLEKHETNSYTPLSNSAQTNAEPPSNFEFQSSQADHSASSHESSAMSLTQVDEATMAVVFSCHCRLTEIFVSLFQMMQTCIQYALRPHLGNDWAVILPRIQIGSIASPPVQIDVDTPLLSKASTSMYMLMTTMLSSHLWDQIAALISIGDDVPTGVAAASSPLLEMMLSTIRDRTGSLLQTIDATKHMLKQ